MVRMFSEPEELPGDFAKRRMESSPTCTQKVALSVAPAGSATDRLSSYPITRHGSFSGAMEGPP